MSAKNKKVGVLMGGWSGEREISLKSGKGVATALRSRGYQVVEIDVQSDVAQKIAEARIEIAVVMLHGHHGEDGTIQGLLEVMGIPYTGSGPLACALAMNKDLSKRLAQSEGVPTPEWKAVRRESIPGLHESPMPLPVVVKPNQEGSTLGISIVRKQEEFRPALELAAKHDAILLIEKFIEGKEITVGLLNGQPLPVIEIVPRTGFYNFEAKYTKGMTEYIVPARISEGERQEAAALAQKVYRLLGMAGVARADFRLAKRPWFLEINAIPGMTETSLVPKAAAACGISYEDLCERLIGEASLKI